jgi:hypothetical protein
MARCASALPDKLLGSICPGRVANYGKVATDD